MKVFGMKVICFYWQAKSFEMNFSVKSPNSMMLPLEYDEFCLQEVTGDTRATPIRAISTVELIMTE